MNSTYIDNWNSVVKSSDFMQKISMRKGINLLGFKDSDSAGFAVRVIGSVCLVNLILNISILLMLLGILVK